MNAMKTLYLTLHRQWFVEILRGMKTEEFRDRTPHWQRLIAKRNFDAIHFRNGYQSDAPEMLIECRGVEEKEHNGRIVFALQLGKIVAINGLAEKLAA